MKQEAGEGFYCVSAVAQIGVCPDGESEIISGSKSKELRRVLGHFQPNKVEVRREPPEY